MNYLDTSVKHVSYIRDAASKIEVARRTVTDSRIPTLDEVQLRVLEMNAMREDSFLPQKTKFVVGCGVRLARGEEFPRKSDFGRVLADVGLDCEVGMFSRDGSQATHKLIAARDGEARGKDWLNKRV